MFLSTGEYVNFKKDNDNIWPKMYKKISFIHNMNR